MAAEAGAADAAEASDRLPQVGDCVLGERTRRKFRLLALVGDGGYGRVFEASDGSRKVAVKTEKYSKSMLHIEVNVLRAASVECCKHIVELLDHGVCRPNYCYMVMPLLGKDLHRLRNEQKERKFSLGTAVRLGALGLRELHEKCGFLSRDVKPGNFACGHPHSNQRRNLFLIDFGLARRFMDKNKNILPSRKEVGWRGTTRYGSLQAHLKQDLGRKDDVESWFYMLVEITRGGVPWRTLTDRNTVHGAKLAARTQGRAAFLADCPKEFDLILAHVDSLSFPDAPNYALIQTQLADALARARVGWDAPFDWEEGSNMSSAKNSTSPPERQAQPPAPVREHVLSRL